MVLAAGLGTRMRPITERVPKPMVRLAGRPLLDHVLDRLAEAGIARAVVNVHYLPDQIEKHLAGRRSPEIRISDERDALLDTGGGVMRALPLLGKAPFVVHNSDTVWAEGIGSNLRRMLDMWDAGRMDCLMLLASASTSIGYDGRGDFGMAADGRLARRSERQSAPFVFAGVSIMSPTLLEGMPAKGAFSLNRTWDRAAEQGRLYGLRLDGVWMHIGTPEALETAERWLGSEQTR
jgi:MurNAc alpha-1-phosphate uridylyltransferase